MFLKNRNISSKIKRSKVTDYAALILYILMYSYNKLGIVHCKYMYLGVSGYNFKKYIILSEDLLYLYKQSTEA